MDIGPISAIRPVTMVRPSAAAPDLSHVYEVEYLGEPGDDEYTPANREAARGLEEEDEPEELAAQDGQPRAAGSGTVSLFA